MHGNNSHSDATNYNEFIIPANLSHSLNIEHSLSLSFPYFVAKKDYKKVENSLLKGNTWNSASPLSKADIYFEHDSGGEYHISKQFFKDSDSVNSIVSDLNSLQDSYGDFDTIEFFVTENGDLGINILDTDSNTPESVLGLVTHLCCAKISEDVRKFEYQQQSSSVHKDHGVLNSYDSLKHQLKYDDKAQKFQGDLSSVMGEQVVAKDLRLCHDISTVVNAVHMNAHQDFHESLKPFNNSSRLNVIVENLYAALGSNSIIVAMVTSFSNMMHNVKNRFSALFKTKTAQEVQGTLDRSELIALREERASVDSLIHKGQELEGHYLGLLQETKDNIQSLEDKKATLSHRKQELESSFIHSAKSVKPEIRVSYNFNRQLKICFDGMEDMCSHKSVNHLTREEEIILQNVMKKLNDPKKILALKEAFVAEISNFNEILSVEDLQKFVQDPHLLLSQMSPENYAQLHQSMSDDQYKGLLQNIQTQFVIANLIREEGMQLIQSGNFMESSVKAAMSKLVSDVENHRVESVKQKSNVMSQSEFNDIDRELKSIDTKIELLNVSIQDASHGLEDVRKKSSEFKTSNAYKSLSSSQGRDHVMKTKEGVADTTRYDKRLRNELDDMVCFCKAEGEHLQSLKASVKQINTSGKSDFINNNISQSNPNKSQESYSEAGDTLNSHGVQMMHGNSDFCDTSNSLHTDDVLQKLGEGLSVMQDTSQHTVNNSLPNVAKDDGVNLAQ